MDHAQLVACAEKRINDWDDIVTRVAKDKAHEDFLREYVRPGRFNKSIFQRAMYLGSLRHKTLPPHDMRGGEEWEYWRSHRGRQYVSVKCMGFRIIAKINSFLDELEERSGTLEALQEIDGVTNEDGALLLSNAEATLAGDSKLSGCYEVASDLVKALNLLPPQDHHVKQVIWPCEKQAAARAHTEGIRLRRRTIVEESVSWMFQSGHIKECDYRQMRRWFPPHNVVAYGDLDTAVHASLIARAVLFGKSSFAPMEDDLELVIDRYLGPVDDGAKDEEFCRLWVTKFFPADGAVLRPEVSGTEDLDVNDYLQMKSGENEATRMEHALMDYTEAIERRNHWKLPRMLFTGLILPHVKRAEVQDIAAIREYARWMQDALQGFEDGPDRTVHDMPAVPPYTPEEQAADRLMVAHEREVLELACTYARAAGQAGNLMQTSEGMDNRPDFIEQARHSLRER
ncbi:hypothetical protein LTR95_016545 [Oleoguttula sp. CCFEE 5521]